MEVGRGGTGFAVLRYVKRCVPEGKQGFCSADFDADTYPTITSMEGCHVHPYPSPNLLYPALEYLNVGVLAFRAWLRGK